MTDRTPSEIDREPQFSSTVIPFEPAAAYTLGYADGRRLFAEQPDASVQPVRRRFLAHADLGDPSPAEQAYLAGIRDAAADNLPSPPVKPHRHAA